jgi:NADPH:quinone reductase-like Zn-dependent oxidoreductase
MRAVFAKKAGGPEVLQHTEVQTPEPGPGEVRIRLHAAALNHLDIWVRQGLLGVRYPLILGNEGSGEVDAIGAGVSGLREGDPVIAAPGQGCGRCRECGAGQESCCAAYSMLGYQRNGTYAEAVIVPAESAVPKPDRLSWEQAAAFPLVFLTAWHMIFDRGRIRPGEDVLVMAAGSGVGQAAVQVARLAGARVIATAGSEEKRKKARELGAYAAVDYTRDGWHENVRQHTDGRGVDLVIEHTGADYWDSILRCLATRGRVVTCGATTGPQVGLDLRFFFIRQHQVIGSYMGSRGELMEALELAGSGLLTPVVDRSYPLKEAAWAQQRMASRASFGKIVLLP